MYMTTVAWEEGGGGGGGINPPPGVLLQVTSWLGVTIEHCEWWE